MSVANSNNGDQNMDCVLENWRLGGVHMEELSVTYSNNKKHHDHLLQASGSTK